MCRILKDGFCPRHPWGVRPWTRHSLVLMVAGLIYASIGVAYRNLDVSEERLAALQVALSLWPLEIWGDIFLVSGILAFISSRWPVVAETWGYIVLTGLSAAWGATYAMGVILGESPGSNYTTAALWSLVAFMWWAISGLLNPEKVRGPAKRGST